MVREKDLSALAGLLATVSLLLAGSARAQKIGTLVLSANARQAALAGRLSMAIEESLARSRDLYHWRDLVASKAPSVAAEATLKQKTQDALTNLKANDPGHAPIADLQAALKASAVTVSVADVQAAEAAMAAVAWAAQDISTSESRIADALSYDPNLRAPEVAEPPGFAQLWDRTRFAVNDHARGELSITSEPAGARVLVDGASKGTTPLVVQGLLTGPHLVQLDLFGYALAGDLVQMSGPEGSYSVKLGPADQIAEVDLKNGVIAATLNDNGKLIAELGRKLGLQSLVVGWLAPKGSNVILALAAVKVDNGHVLAAQELPLEGDEYGQAGARASSLASSLLEGKTGGAKGGASQKSKAKDPLEGKDGTEDW